jgi:multidrug efflux pump subunit AcrB
MKALMTAFAKNTVFANIVLVLIFLAGTMAAMSMIRENFPEFSLDMIKISVAYPGADPEEVEEGISRKIEEAIEGIEGIKMYTTTSAENYSSAIIEVLKGNNLNDVLDRVRNKVDSISTFPLDSEKPIITELTLTDPVFLLYLSGNISEKLLKEWVESLKDEIQLIPSISQVETFGVRDYEIGIEISEERLREYGLTFSQVSEAIRRSNLNLAGGIIRTQGEEIRVRTMGRKYTGEQLASIVVKATPEGHIITLDRVSQIRDDFMEDPMRAEVNGEPSALLIVSKTPEEDALAISQAMTQFVKKKQQELPSGANLKILYDNTDMLRDRINLLIKNGAIGLCLVFILLWLFMDIRLSFWAGMGIPVSIAGALMIIWTMGETLNMISLFGLIMVLGIVVDDAIVVGESIFVKRQMGMPPLKAAVEGVCEVGLPIVCAVITTIIAFTPLAFVGGIMGKFIAILPTVVIACLAISLVECLILLPAHLSNLPDPHIKKTRNNVFFRATDALHQGTQDGLEWFVKHIYCPLLKKAIQWRYISFSTAVAILLLTLGLVIGGLLKFEVFPEVDGFVINANIEFPNGTPQEITQKAVQQIDAALLNLAEKTPTLSNDPLLESRLSFVGTTFGQIPEHGPHVGGVQAILLDSAKRGIHSKDLMVAWEKEIGPIPGIKSLTLEGMQQGPPGAPIEVWLQAHNMENILSAADDLMEQLRKYDGVYQIRSDFSPGKNELRLSLKPEAKVLGLTVEDLARQIYAGYFGEEAVRLQRGRDDIRVRVRYSSDERKNLSDLEQVRIRTLQGSEVPLFSVADYHFSPGYSTIVRTDGMRRVAVSANVDTNKANANEIFEELNRDFFNQLEKRYSGLHVSLQGEQKKMRESFDSLYVGFPVAILGIFIIIATIFRSYAQPFVIMFTIPFGIIGGILGHLVLGYDLSIMSIFGFVALSGVVVNDAIVMIERINENLAEKMPFSEAVIQGGIRRFRAVILTTLSTVGGLTPLIMETNFQARFLIPMALSLAAGVAFATILTLVLIPSLLTILNDLRRMTIRIRTGQWATREDVEPSSRRYLDEPIRVHTQEHYEPPTRPWYREQ